MRESHCEPINPREIMTTKPSKNSEEANLQDLVAFLCGIVAGLSQGQRYMLGVTGCPGAGKSTVSEWLVNGVNEKLPHSPAMVVPMDGFHFSNEQLKEMKLLEFKGIPDSFDATGFVDLLRRLRTITNKNVYCPLFDRSIEASIEDAIVIEPKSKLCIVEGNYLLVQKKPWDECRSYFDQVWFIDVTFDTIMPRLLTRHIQGGRTQEGAKAKIDGTDLPNANLIEQTKPYADRLIRLAMRET
jgi:pantothenate kinase